METEKASSEIFDVVIIGAGLAGLQCAKFLVAENLRILLVDRKTRLSSGVHTTGIFVRKTFEDFEFPQGTLGKPISNVNLYSPGLRKLELKSDKAEFRVGRMGFLYESLLKECVEKGIEVLDGTRYVSTENIADGSASQRVFSLVKLEKGGVSKKVRTKVLIGADGARSRVAKDLGLDENKHWIVGYEEIYKGVPLKGEPILDCFLDSKLSPGYLAWITNDGEDSHIGVGGYPSRFNPREALEVFKNEVAGKFVNLADAELVESRGGRIPVGGVLKRIANERGLLIGDAAGAVSPLTAGGLDPCMRLSKFASEVVLRRLEKNDSRLLLKYSGEMFRAKFTSRLFMRTVLKTFCYKAFLELGCAFLRGSIGRKFAEKIFFRRGSFPNAELEMAAADQSPINGN